MKRDVFISYSRRNYDEVWDIKKQIDSACGTDCWMDLKGGIEAGAARYDTEIIEGVKNCNVFLFMLSRESQESENAIGEIDLAKARGKRIVLVNIDNCELNDYFILHYGRADIIYWNNSLQREKIMRYIKSWIHDVKLVELERRIEQYKIIPRPICNDPMNGRIDPKTGIKYHGKWGYKGVEGLDIWDRARSFKSGMAAVAIRNPLKMIKSYYEGNNKTPVRVLEYVRYCYDYLYDNLECKVYGFISLPDIRSRNIDYLRLPIIPYQYKAVNDFNEDGYAIVADFEDNVYKIDKLGLIVENLGKRKYN